MYHKKNWIVRIIELHHVNYIFSEVTSILWNDKISVINYIKLFQGDDVRFKLDCTWLFILVVLFVANGCVKKHHPLTHELLETGVSFVDIPNGVEEFDAYAAAPASKAFAAAVQSDGLVHAWAKA